MEIRKAELSDIPQIVALLKLSLGESLMPKSVQYWTWKHLKNPFGRSPVLLACAGGNIVGVRAFMRWRWRQGEEEISAIRAVDTATHPGWQGRGIFKKLTLGMLERCEEEKTDMVFNTPNQKSKPGYLKMGWQEAGKLPLKAGIKRPLPLIFNKIFRSLSTRFVELKLPDYSLEKAIERFDLSKIVQSSRIGTDYSRAYLKWRYLDIPVIRYYGLASDCSLLIFRLKQGPPGTELRITDAFGDENTLQQGVKELMRTLHFDYMSVSGFSTLSLPLLLRKSGNFGPGVTVRPLYRKNIDDFAGFAGWSPSLGDLEVF